MDIGESFKISSVKLPENVVPTISGRDFVIATLAAPTIIKEPEKPVEETAEGAEGDSEATATEGSAESSEQKPAEGDKSDKKDGDDKKKTPEKKVEKK